MLKYAPALILGLSFLFVRCTMGGENKDKMAETSTNTMTDTTVSTPATTTPANQTTVSDTAAMKNLPANAAVKPNPAKKGKKGKVSISMTPNKAASDAAAAAADKEGYYTNVYPAYPGGQKALEDYFAKNVEYPQEATDNGVEGTVNVSFAVDEKGKISGVKTTNSTIGYGLEEEAIRMINKMPSWTPGSLKGKNVKTRYSIPVRFELSE
jgi:TonB family protein